jgi:RNA polymerase sigma-70 factor (ECF subfamily)
LEFHSFDREYVQKLAEGDSVVERHFVSYFSGLLLMKLRYRLRSGQEVEDLMQEVFLRVLLTLRQGQGVQQPERLGAFVNAVCNNVVLEHFRNRGRMAQWDDQFPEPRDTTVDLERRLVSEQSKQRVRALIEELSAKDRRILKAVFLEEQDKETVCHEFGVDRDYLRVLLHRAKSRFRRLMMNRTRATAG